MGKVLSLLKHTPNSFLGGLFMKNYSTFGVARMLNTTRSAVQLWLDKNFVKPSVYAAEGPGTKNIFSENDIYKIFLFKILQEAGIRQSEASSISKKIDLEGLGEDQRYIVLKRKKSNGKFVNSVFIAKELKPEYFISSSDIELTTIIDALKFKNIIDGLK
jgi:hypothetical protein